MAGHLVLIQSVGVRILFGQHIYGFYVITPMKKCKKCNEPFEPRKNFLNYCSYKCRFDHVWSEENRVKQSIAVKSSDKVAEAFKNRVKKPSKIKNFVCHTCNKNFQSYYSNRKYCSQTCKHKNPDRQQGGYREGSGRAKSGYYKGIYCGSSYELAWVIFQIDHGIDFKRFDHTLDDGETKYIPDFIIGDTIYEMKGYESQESVDKKTKLAESFGYKVKVLRKKDLKVEFDWVKEHYTYRNIWDLYDDYKPKYSYVCKYCSKSFSTDRKVKTEIKFCSRECVYSNKRNSRKHGALV